MVIDPTGLDSRFVNVSGDTMTGLLQFSGTNHAGLQLLSLTTAQRDALTPANGMIIYNTTASEFQAYENGAWATMIGGTETDPLSIHKDGSVSLTANWDAGSFKITAETLESDVATGTAPFVVASTTEVTNLRSATASKWATARTISMTGDVSSDAVSIDGSGNVTITNTVVANDSHTHSIYLNKDGSVALAGAWNMGNQALTNVNVDSGVITGITDLLVADGGTGRSSATAFAVVCGGTTSTGALQSVAGVGSSGQVLTSNGAGALPTFQDAAGGADTFAVIQVDGVAQSTNAPTLDFSSSDFNLTESPTDDFDIVLDDSKKTFTRFLEIENPVATDGFLMGFVKDAVTITEIKAETDTGTVDFNIEERAFGSGESAGTDVNSTEIVATDAGVTDTSFSNAAIAAGSYLYYSASAVASSPTNLKVMVSYTVD